MKNIPPLMLFILLLSCNKSSNYQTKIKSATLTLVDKYEIETVKDIIESNHTSIFYYDWEGFPEIIAAYSKIDNTIYLYNYRTAELYKKINLDHLGIKYIRTFQFKDPSTLVVVEELSTNFFVLDSNGVEINRFNFNYLDPNLNSAVFSCNNGGVYGNSMKFFKEYLVVSMFPFNPDPIVLNYHYDLIIADYEGDNPLVKNDVTIVDSIKFFRNISFDISKWKNFKVVYTVVKGDSLFFKHHHTDNIYLYDIENKSKLEVITISGSKAIQKNRFFDINQFANAEYMVDFIIKNFGYTSVVYDQYRKLFYITVEHGNFEYEYESLYFQWSGVKPFSVMIFDENFRYLNEINFPAYKYGYRAPIIPTKDGILISKQNSFNPDRKSYKIQYDLFSVDVEYE